VSNPHVEAGVFEAQGISGVSMARGHDVAGIRLAFPHPALGLYDDRYILMIMDAPDAYAPDLSYVRYSWRVPVTDSGIRKVAGWPCKSVNSPVVFDLEPDEAARVTVEWAFDGKAVTGRYSSDKPVRVGLFVNGCFAPGQVVASSPDSCRLQAGDSVLDLGLSGNTEAPMLIDTRPQAEQAWAGLVEAKGTAMALFPIELAPDTRLHFCMRILPVESRGTSVPSSDPSVLRTRGLVAGNEQDARATREQIDTALVSAAAAYEEGRMRSTAMCDGAAEAVAALSGYARVYDPGRARVQTTVNRTWAGTNTPGIIFGWDNFFTSYIAAWENPALGAASLEHIVSVYGEKGIAHGPTQRNLIIPILYTRTLDVLGNEAVARRTWPTMMEFMRFWFADRGDGHPWRDGNDDGLIESGANTDAAAARPGFIVQEAMDETGYDELPSTSAGFTEERLGMLADNVSFDWFRRTLTLTEIGQNSLYVASCKAMARWAERLGENADAEWLRGEEERVASGIRERLFCKEDGFFRDRYWDGAFSPVKTMTLFYPLLAGVADEKMKDKLKQVLLDPRQFWGDNVIPTVSRDDPAYCDGLDGRGNYWRGNCWPSATYIVYLAIKEAGWDDVAAEFAKRTCSMFLEYWDRHGHAYENFPPEGKVDHRFLYVVPWGGRELRYVWSAMMLFCGLEEVFGPEAGRPGVRFGNPHLPSQTAWKGFLFSGERVEAEAGPERTWVKMGELWEFSAEPGMVVRSFERTEEGFRFEAVCQQKTAVSINAPGILPGGTASLALQAGRHEVRV